jgi:hypothetical protein
VIAQIKDYINTTSPSTIGVTPRVQYVITTPNSTTNKYVIRKKTVIKMTDIKDAEIPIDDAISMDYTYNRRGGMIFQGYTYNKAFGTMAKNAFTWRCQRSTSVDKCAVKLKTVGQKIVSMRGKHLHEQYKIDQAFKSLVYEEDKANDKVVEK